MAKSEFERIIEAQGSRILQTPITRSRFIGGMMALGSLGLAACGPVREPQIRKKVVPQILTPPYNEDLSLTPEAHAIARHYSQDAVATASEFLSDGYLYRGFNFNTTPEEYWARKQAWEHDGEIWVVENIFTGSFDDDTSQPFTVFNFYDMDGKTIKRRELITGNVPAILNTGSIPGRPLGDSDPYSLNIPKDTLRTVADAVFDLPSGLDWKEDVDVYDDSPLPTFANQPMWVYPSLKASGKINGKTFDFRINNLPSAFLTVTEPTV